MRIAVPKPSTKVDEGATATPCSERSAPVTAPSTSELAALQRLIEDQPASRLAPSKVQKRGSPSGAATLEAPEPIREAGRVGTSGASGPLPYLDKIQKAFGRHDVSTAAAHTDGAASAGARAMGAEAFTMGRHVAFDGEPSLRTAAHEAAHVVQQRAGVWLEGGVGRLEDRYERHADAVAGEVVAGRSAEALLDAAVGGGSAGVQRKVSDGPAPNPEQALIRAMIDKGQRDESGLANAVFYLRHPDRTGKTLAKGSPLAKEWLSIRDTIVRPALAAPAAAPAAAPPAAGAAPEGPGILQRGVGVVTDLAQAAYNAVAGWFSSDEHATPPPGKVKPAPAGAPASTAEGEKRFRTNTPTIEGGTLDIAKTRADKGDAGTHYSLEGQGLAASLMSGDKEATVFYCSGLSIWTLAAAGYDVAKAIVGEDGVPYTWTKVTVQKGKDGKVKKDKDGNDVEKETETNVTLKQIVDGEPSAVEAMTIAEQKGMKKGGSVGRLSGKAPSLGHAAESGSTAVKGAAGAFELAKIGYEIAEAEQKPGDFAQSRRTSAGEGSDTEIRYRGKGHAWQVWAVRAKGAAMFGRKGSPVPTTAGLTGWHEGVEFVLDKDTDPALVGAHQVMKASRIEANIAGAGNLASSKKDDKADGGVQITGEHEVPDKGLKGYTDYVVYYGRLGTSPWARWKPATKP